VRALVAHAAGDLRIDELPSPVPGAGEVAVRIRYGGICGSDLHYWRHGRVGDFWLREPLVLGHEVVGTVEALGAGVTGPEPGTPVAVHPATVCHACPECRAGRHNLCREVRYLGSAARLPHVQGGLTDVLVAPVDRIVPLPDGLGLRDAAIVEPATVAWHAASRGGDVRGRRVLVTGAGPIGCLVVAALARSGAAEIVVTDVARPPLDIAVAVGASSGVVVGTPAADGLDGYEMDVAIESSGSPAGLATCVRAVHRGGRVVSLGLLPPGEVPVPANLVVTRELELVGTFRFHTEMPAVLAAIADGSLVTGPVVTHVRPLTDAAAAADAFALAGDPARSGKVLLDLGGESG
jgi:L-idonate 5-dehydrogenase